MAGAAALIVVGALVGSNAAGVCAAEDSALIILAATVDDTIVSAGRAFFWFAMTVEGTSYASDADAIDFAELADGVTTLAAVSTITCFPPVDFKSTDASIFNAPASMSNGLSFPDTKQSSSIITN